jgi:diadenosine tetraphosphatase ApaH/serine/threonine PP2A family protein phosphatase
VRVGVISDVHGNLDALEAVLAAIGSVDQVWCLGDIVGYGPEPNEVVARLAALDHLAVAGNHDWAAVGKLGVEEFNPYAAEAVRWTRRQLAPETLAYLTGLPNRARSGDFTLVHGSPRDPIWEYVLSAPVAGACFGAFDGPFCLVGHTHVPSIFLRGEDGEVRAHRIVDDADVSLDDPSTRTILNAGSVGQPRDDDPRASCLILDTERLTASWRRVAYPIGRTQEKMGRAGLPARLIDRLSAGW